MLFFRLEQKNMPYEKLNGVVNKGAYALLGTEDPLKCLADLCLHDIAGGREAFDDEKHPLPDRDYGLKEVWEDAGGWDRVFTSPHAEANNYVFGFESLASLRRWFLFEEGMEAIKDIGCIGVYEVEETLTEAELPSFVQGQFQAMAHVDHMNRVDELSTTAK